MYLCNGNGTDWDGFTCARIGVAMLMSNIANPISRNDSQVLIFASLNQVISRNAADTLIIPV